MRYLALVGLCLTLAACQGQATDSTCHALYAAFASELDMAIAARRDDDSVGALYHLDGAQMNLDVLLARGCCRLGDTCPAMISL